MHYKNVIRSVCGWVLLVLFSFSITPRQLLHDVLADHTDAVEVPAKGHIVIAKKGYSCDRLSLVAESPFTATEKHIELVTPFSFTEFIVPEGNSISFTSVTLPTLRGPPCI
ncbi:MAG TPA: hypothetical protein VD996_06480 [Chitinophagaceae bacterium]|nr:hypothetical protein [Chitinophagaceae bacterium]